MFESSVNSEGIETVTNKKSADLSFESSVNSEGIETLNQRLLTVESLRAV